MTVRSRPSGPPRVQPRAPQQPATRRPCTPLRDPLRKGSTAALGGAGTRAPAFSTAGHPTAALSATLTRSSCGAFALGKGLSLTARVAHWRRSTRSRVDRRPKIGLLLWRRRQGGPSAQRGDPGAPRSRTLHSSSPHRLPSTISQVPPALLTQKESRQNQHKRTISLSLSLSRTSPDHTATC